MSTVRRFLRLQRMLDSYQRGVHLRILAERVLGPRREFPFTRNDVRKVLFVCHGNIMRSAFAEAYFKKLAAQTAAARPSVSASSAGVFATPGRGADPRTIAIGAELGLHLEEHSATMISPDLVEDADLICVMDTFNEVVCRSRFPGAKDKIFRLGVLVRNPGGSPDIDDPFMGSGDGARISFQRVQRAVDSLWSLVGSPPEKS